MSDEGHEGSASMHSARHQLMLEAEKIARQMGAADLVRFHFNEAVPLGRATRLPDGQFEVAFQSRMATAPASMRQFLVAHELAHVLSGGTGVSDVRYLAWMVSGAGLLLGGALAAAAEAANLTAPGRGLGLFLAALAGMISCWNLAHRRLRRREYEADQLAAAHGFPLTPEAAAWSQAALKRTPRALRFVATHPTWAQRLPAMPSSNPAVQCR